MKQILNRTLGLLLLFVSSLQASANRGGFYYRNIAIDAVVHENNVWDVEETFDIVFEEPRHGFYRYIPRQFSLNHNVSPGGTPDLQQFRYIVDIDHISVDGAPFTTTDSNSDFCIVRIGNPDREVEGLQRYVIRYTYTYPDDRLPQGDCLFHTVLGTEFEDPIRHVEFSISFDKPLPDDIDSRLQVFSGEYGSTDGIVPALSVEATPDRISGEADDVAPRHGITLYAQLPADYYVGARTITPIWFYVFLALTALLMLVIAFLQFRQTTPHVTKVIEFYPPEDISSAEVGTIIDTSVDTSDIASLIPWLAGKGYLSIKEVTKGKLLFKENDLELTKLKDLPDSAPAYQKKLMRLLFGDGQQVRMKDIGEKPDEFGKITKSLKKHFTGKHKLSSLRWPFWLYIPLAVVATLALGCDSVVSSFDFDLIVSAAALFGLPFLLAVILRKEARRKDLIRSRGRRILLFLLKALLMLVMWFVFGYFLDYGAPLNRWGVLVVYVVCFLLGELAGRFEVDTDYRVQMMGRLLGFKEFIETAEKQRLEQLQADDPQYFYRVLPYAMVFGLSKKWTNLFKDINVEKPDWYDAASPLTGFALTKNLTSSLYSTASSAISTISHDSSSSGGGGGFSGGGGGGGGGGSW